MSSSDSTIQITNVGPISSLELALPDGGGVVVLQGHNGAGKSTAIRAVHALAGAKEEDLTPRDGEATGDIVGCGAHIHLSVASKKRATRGGSLAVKSLGSDVDPGVLVDPGLVDPEAADMRRARVLCSLAGVKPDITQFRRLLEDSAELDEIVSAEARATDSLPAMARLVKRDIEKAARASEDARKQAETRAGALMTSIGDLDLRGETDEVKLRAAVDKSLRDLSEAKGAARGAEERRKAFESAKAALDAATLAGGMPTVSEAEESVAMATSLRDEKQRLVEDLRDSLREAEAELATAVAVLTERVSMLNAARRATASLKASQDVVVAGLGDEGPTSERIAELEKFYAEARAAQERGTLIRQALHHQEQAQEQSIEAQMHESRAERLRQAARGCWDVVAEAVARLGVAGLRFRDGRLVIDHGRGEVPFADLSEGERWSAALPACLAAVGRGGLLAISQEAWEGLDPNNRARVQAAAREAGAWILTAEATDGDLRATTQP